MPVFVSYVVYFKKDKRQIICVAYTVFFSYICEWFAQHTNNDWQTQSPDSMIFKGNQGPN